MDGRQPISARPFGLGDAEVLPARNRIVTGGEEAQLEPKVMSLLCALASQPGEVIVRDHLLETIWARQFGGDESLTRAVSLLRKILGADAIETIPKRGYRLTLPVAVRDKPEGAEAPAPPAQPAGTPVEAARPGWRAALQRATRAPRWSFVAAGLALAATVAAAFALQPHREAVAETASLAEVYRSIAVMPFQDQSASGDQQHFADGIAEQVLNRLSRSPELKVSARASSFALRGQDPIKAAKMLGVQTVLDGTVQRSGERVRVSAQLVDVSTGFSLWSDSYERPIDDLFAVQDEISDAIAERLKARMGGQTAVLSLRTRNSKAYEAFLEGDFHFGKGDTASLEKARDAYQRAIALDPDYAPAYAKLSICLLMLPHDSDGVARAPMRKAVQLAPYLPESRWAETYYYGHIRDYAQQNEALARLRELDPNSTVGKIEQLRAYAQQRRFLEAEKLAEEVVAVDPIGVESNALFARVMARRGRSEDAIRRGQWALRFNPDAAELRLWTAAAYCEKGDLATCVSEFITIFEAAPRDVTARFYLSRAMSEMGFAEEAIALSDDPVWKLQNTHDVGRTVTADMLASAAQRSGISENQRAQLAIIGHDMRAALPWLEDLHRRNDHSNFVEHPSDYKPYLSIARRLAGDADGADEIDREVFAEIEQGKKSGDESVMLFSPFEAYAAAARNDRSTLFQVLDKMAAHGFIYFIGREPIFDSVRDDPRFAAVLGKLKTVRASQRQNFGESIKRIDRVLAAQARGQ